jgi:serine/threonine protein kinase
VSRATAQDFAPPAIPGYSFLRHLGAGGNAQVYLYEQELPHRQVAVKVLNESVLSEAAQRRFTAEANVTAALSHRHIVQVFEARVTDDGQPYLVMPYYPQPNLSVRARRSQFSVPQVLRIGIQIGGAVETSHRSGVLHRDIKPQNILTDSYGDPALTDFGIATTKGGDGPEGMSVPWSPPEILYGTGAGDERSDVYSLGATLWHLLVGRSPFEQPGGDNQALALVGRIRSHPVPITGRADVPDSLERLLRRAMAKDPAARPQTALEMIHELQSIEQQLRLPVTHPILPSSEPARDTAGGDTTTMRALSTGDTTHGRRTDPSPGGSAAGNTSAREQTAARPVGPARRDTAAPRDPADRHDPAWAAQGPAQAPRVAAPSAEEDPTRARGPRRLDPWGPASARPQPNASGGTPAAPRQGREADAPGPRDRVFPAAPAEGATGARPRALAPDAAAAASGQSGAEAKGKHGRVLAFAAGGAALAVAAVVAVLALSNGGGQPSTPVVGAPATQAGGADNALGEVAPGTPTITAKPIGKTGKVEFSWTYANPQGGDSFELDQTIGTVNKQIPTTKHEIVVTPPPGQAVCYAVQVYRDGLQSDFSPTKCSAS